MRQITINGVNLTYPEELVFLWDSNSFQLEGSANSRIGYDLNLTNTNYETRSLNYRSGFSNKITVPLTEAIQSLFESSSGSMIISAVLTIWQDGVNMGMMTWAMNVLEGRTLSYKRHGGNKIIHIYSQDELQNVQVYSDEICDLFLGTSSFHIYKGLNSLDLSGLITTNGVYSLCFTQGTGAMIEIISVTDITPSSSIIHLNYQVNEEDIGDVRKMNIYKPDDLRNCYFLVYGKDMSFQNGQLCESSSKDGEFAELRYRDTDGSMRYIGGQILSDELGYEGFRYNRVNPMLLFKKPLRHVLSHETILTLGFTDLERASGFDEILLSSMIEMRCGATDNEWIPCIIEDSIIRNGGEDRYDAELQVKVS